LGHWAAKTFAVEIGSGAVGIFVLVAGLALGALVVAAMAVTARRLLGVRVGAGRTTAAGGVVYVDALLVATTIIKPVGPGKSVLAPEFASAATPRPWRSWMLWTSASPRSGVRETSPSSAAITAAHSH